MPLSQFIMNFFKIFNKKAKETDQADDGLKLFLDFELKTFKYLAVDDFTKCDSITLMIIDDLLKFDLPVIIYGQQIIKTSDFPFKKYSALFLVIRVHQANNIITQRKLNFYECPLAMLREKEKNYDYSFVFCLNESASNILQNPSPQVGRRNSKRNSGNLKTKFSPKKKKKNDINQYDEEKIVRSGNLKKKTKKGDFVEKIFVLFTDKLVYYEPKDKGYLLKCSF